MNVQTEKILKERIQEHLADIKTLNLARAGVDFRTEDGKLEYEDLTHRLAILSHKSIALLETVCEFMDKE